MDIKTLNINDENYPKRLKEIADAPKKLYYKGELKSDELCFAIVGTRRASAYGKQVALTIAGDLASAGLTIVSGLAPGIDTFCHQATLEAKDRTMAVLGTGIDEESLYPKENLKLARDIVESGGCLISEYPPGTPGSKFTFPKRNRIISGLCLGVLVIEAKQKSGALITAHYGFSQKRKVFAVPGSIYSLNSKGCHHLIKKGAILAENADDILKELNLSLGLAQRFKPLAGENQEESLILELLKQGPLDIDKIIEKTGFSASLTASTLTVLEIENKVRKLGGNVYGLIGKMTNWQDD